MDAPQQTPEHAMDPEEWQRLAEQIAAHLASDIDALEARFWPEPEGNSFRPFWTEVRALNERVRTAPAIKLDDKMALQHRLNELCQRARQHQRALEERGQALRAELLDALTLAADTLAESETVEQIQEVRADLQLLRNRINENSAVLQRAGQRDVWEAWQQANQSAWDRLNAAWAANEAFLTALLTEAETKLQASDPRGAKETIKAFHASVAAHECAHRSLRGLRSRANSIWQAADEVGRQKREAYVANASRRLGQWRAAHDRNERLRAQLQQQISDLEYRQSVAPTDVAAALLRGQLAERRRALQELDAADRDLLARISAAESTLGG